MFDVRHGLLNSAFYSQGAVICLGGGRGLQCAATAVGSQDSVPRSRSNDGKTLVQVDFAEISHSPVSRVPQKQGGDHAVTALNQRIEASQADVIEMDAVAAAHRADFEKEYDRTSKPLAEPLKASVEIATARKERRYSKESYRY
jgi:hypothetical protein